MGRPLNKRYFGATSDGSDLSNEQNLTVSVKVGSNGATALGIVLSQRSESKFKVNDDPTNDPNGNIGVCTLVNKSTDTLLDNEMSLQGFVVDGEAVYIRKVQNRTMVDFNDNHYTWEIQDDSTANILVLTGI